MRTKLASAARKTMSATPLYRVLPRGSVRTYAALRYHQAHGSAAGVSTYLETSDASGVRHFSSAMIAARAALRASRDDLVEELVTSAAERFPDKAEPHVLRADLAIYRGDYDAALDHARRGQFLDPRSAAAAARVVRLTYIVDQLERADAVAVEAIRNHPRSTPVQWAVCKESRSPEQYLRIIEGWLDAVPPYDEPGKLEPRLPPFATAAARAGLLDSAIDLYAQAILLRLDGVNPDTVVSEKQLRGKGAWTAVTDVCEVLEAADIPFFFAAGTTLGLVRSDGPLSHDSDIDVGVFEQDWDHEALVKAFVGHPSFDIDVAHPDHDKIYLKHRRGSSLDIWQFRERDGKVWHDGLLTSWWNTPFGIQTREVRGRQLPIPEDEDRYLTECYGDWRTPNPDFDAFIEAPNVETTWPEYLEFHRMRQAYRAITAQEVRTAVNIMAPAREALRQTPSGHRLAEVMGL